MRAPRKLEPGTFKVTYVRKSDGAVCVSPAMGRKDAYSFARWLHSDPTVVRSSIEVIL